MSVFIQLIGFVGTALYFLSYQYKDNKTLFKVQYISYFFYVSHFFLLGALTGSMSYSVNLIRCHYLSRDNHKSNAKTICIIFCLLQVLVLIFTWNSWISLLPVIANIASTIASFTNSAKKIRATGLLINAPLWIIYNCIVGSWAGVIDELICLSSLIISIIRHGWNNYE